MSIDRKDTLNMLCRIKREIFDYGDSELLDDVIELYEKAVPKQVQYTSEVKCIDYDEPYISIDIFCPNCGDRLQTIEVDTEYKQCIKQCFLDCCGIQYCSCCGQKLDWDVPEVEFDNEVDTR